MSQNKQIKKEMPFKINISDLNTIVILYNKNINHIIS